MSEDTPTSSSDEPKVYDNPMDEIAGLLMEDESVAEAKDVEETADDEESETTDPLDESQETDEVDDSDNDNDDVEEEDETDEEGERSLAEMLGLDESQVEVDEDSGEFFVNTNSKGDHKKVNLKEVIAGFQTNQVNTQKAQALAEEKRSFDGAVQQRTADIKAQLEHNNALTGFLQQELMQEYQNINWDELRQIDPAEYSAKQYDFQQRHNKLQSVQSELQMSNQRLAEEDQQLNQQQSQKVLGEQRELMLANNPTWKKQEVMKKDIGAIKTYLTDVHGFSDADMSAVMDSRAISIIQDAMKYRAGTKAVKPKLKAAPKIRKSKGRKVAKLSKLDSLTKAAKSATGTNKKKIQDAAIAELFMG